MAALRSQDVFAEWEPVWTELQRVSSLDDDDFLRFVQDLEFDFGVGALDEVPSTLEGAIDLQAQDDLRILATELQACVADPARPRRLDRAELLHRLGWEARLRYKNRHEFPVPGTYTLNATPPHCGGTDGRTPIAPLVGHNTRQPQQTAGSRVKAPWEWWD